MKNSFVISLLLFSLAAPASATFDESAHSLIEVAPGEALTVGEANVVPMGKLTVGVAF